MKNLKKVKDLERKPKIYLVKYWGGDWDDHYTHIVFATTNKSVATKYVKKFNSVLKKWKEYYKQFEYKNDEIWGTGWIKNEHIEQHYNRWSRLRSIDKCYWDEVEIR
jgi:hypothetical protein